MRTFWWMLGLGATSLCVAPAILEKDTPSGMQGAQVAEGKVTSDEEPLGEAQGEPTVEAIMKRIDWSALKGRMKILRMRADEEERRIYLVVEFTRRTHWMSDLFWMYEVVGYDADDILVYDGEELAFTNPSGRFFEVGDRSRAYLEIPPWRYLRPCTKLAIRKRH